MSSNTLDPLDKYRGENHIPMGLPEDPMSNSWSKVKNAASKVFNSLAEIPKTSISSTLKSLTKLSILAASSAAVSGVVQTVAQAGLGAIFERSLSPLSNALKLDTHIKNTTSGLWGFLLFFLGAPILRSIIRDEEIKKPYIPPTPGHALRFGYEIGKNTGISIAAFSIIYYLITSFTAPGTAGVIFTGLGLWSNYKLLKYFFFN